MSGVNDGDGPHLLALFDTAFRQLKAEMDEVFGDEAPGMRSSRLRLLSQTPAEGLRLTDLARRLSTTKQAAGELVGVLQASGHLEVVPDPADGRVRVVRPTPKGVRLTQRVHEEIAALEQRWRTRVGPRRWATFTAVLTELGAATPAPTARPR